MDLARRIAQESYAKRLKVGCVIVKGDNIVSIGWNGTPPGWDNDCEEDNITKPEVFHAEENALLKLSRDGGGAKGAIMFITHAPCLPCSRMIYKAGISNVIYNALYRDDSGLLFLKKCGVDVYGMGLA